MACPGAPPSRGIGAPEVRAYDLAITRYLAINDMQLIIILITIDQIHHMYQWHKLREKLEISNKGDFRSKENNIIHVKCKIIISHKKLIITVLH